MKLCILSRAFVFAAGSALAAGAAMAQTAPTNTPAAPAAAPAPAEPANAPAASAGGKTFKDVRTACLAEVKDKGVKGPERHQAIVDCVSKANPKFGSRMACAQEAHSKNIDKDARKAFMKDCMKSKG